jgi:galactose-1-phosphate uridylyltransferase
VSGFGGGVSCPAALSHPHKPIVASETTTQPLRPNAMRKNSLHLLND